MMTVLTGVGFLGIGLLLAWLLTQVADIVWIRKEEKYRQVKVAEHKSGWDKMSFKQQRAFVLNNFYIPENYLPWVVLDDNGEPALPNFYLGGYGNPDGHGGGYWLMAMSGPGSLGGLFTKEELAIAKTFVEAKMQVTTA
jgi:hypothetical protein